MTWSFRTRLRTIEGSLSSQSRHVPTLSPRNRSVSIFTTIRIVSGPKLLRITSTMIVPDAWDTCWVTIMSTSAQFGTASCKFESGVKSTNCFFSGVALQLALFLWELIVIIRPRRTDGSFRCCSGLCQPPQRLNHSRQSISDPSQSLIPMVYFKWDSP